MNRAAGTIRGDFPHRPQPDDYHHLTSQEPMNANAGAYGLPAHAAARLRATARLFDKSEVLPNAATPGCVFRLLLSTERTSS